MTKPVPVTLLSTLLLALFIPPITANIPYTPSYVLASPQHNDTLAYLLLSDHSEQKTQFLSLDISTNVESANTKYSLLLDKVPFQSNDSPSAFVPVIDTRGIIKVFAGDCQNPNQASVWQFTPSNNSSSGNGTWVQLSVDRPSGLKDKPPVGPNYLAAGFAYPSSDISTSSIYTFGGMCPFQSSSEKDWVSAAKYSKSMTVLNPSGPPNHVSYGIATTGDRAPPIAEAGFTMTPLRPASATTSAGNMMQQQNVLLIGGQTQNAFINMSELAVFSLPQNSWSFVTVDSKLESGRTELAIRDTEAVEPRSGHSAVLTPDGSKVIVFGGWVGKTNVPADPQLAVLEVGEEYGGNGPWTWKAPSTKSIGLTEGAGIYGHGATMLPGGVMMIAGGYKISQSSKRSASGTQQNSQVYLYNVTSNNWVNSYTNPSAQSDEASMSMSHSGSLSSGQKAGLGVGLGLGLPLLIGLVLLGWILLRRRKTRQKREEHIRKLALGAERSHFWAREEQNMANSMRRPQMKQIGAWGQDQDRVYPWAGNRGYGGKPTWRDNGEAVAERTGLLVDVPSPTRNSRQSFSAKLCHASGPSSEFRRSDVAGDIHPIDERDEYEAGPADGLIAASSEPERDSHDLDDPIDIFADAPFLTPRSSNFVGLFGAAHDSSRFATASGARAESGRSSPEKDHNRTSSNLSDSSSKSASANPTVLPQQAQAFFIKPSSAPSSGRQSPEKSASASTGSKDTYPNSVDSAMTPVEKHQSADSFSTAHTTISQRHAESEHLLSDVPEHSTPPSPSKKSPASKPKPDWIGSIRRALSVSRRNSTPAPDSFAALASGIDRSSTVIVPKPLNSENEERPSQPRRAVSASADLFRRKQGARDWGASRYSRGTIFRTPRSTPDGYSLGLGGNDEDDWDVEGAAEGRDVQVTFTVPKERLRVVNASDRDMDNMSEKSISRSSSKAVGGRVVSH